MRIAWVQTENSFLRSLLEARFPQTGCPGAKSSGQRFGSLGEGSLAQKPLGMAIAIGSMPSCHHCQCVSGIAAQIMRWMQAAKTEGTTGSTAVGGGNAGNWRVESEQLSAHTRRSPSPERPVTLSHWRLPVIIALRLPLERSLQQGDDFFPAAVAELLQPCMARTALR